MSSWDLVIRLRQVDPMSDAVTVLQGDLTQTGFLIDTRISASVSFFLYTVIRLTTTVQAASIDAPCACKCVRLQRHTANHSKVRSVEGCFGSVVSSASQPTDLQGIP